MLRLKVFTEISCLFLFSLIQAEEPACINLPDSVKGSVFVVVVVVVLKQHTVLDSFSHYHRLQQLQLYLEKCTYYSNNTPNLVAKTWSPK